MEVDEIVGQYMLPVSLGIAEAANVAEIVVPAGPKVRSSLTSRSVAELTLSDFRVIRRACT